MATLGGASAAMGVARMTSVISSANRFMSIDGWEIEAEYSDFQPDSPLGHRVFTHR